jgi:hypothetical protein
VWGGRGPYNDYRAADVDDSAAGDDDDDDDDDQLKITSNEFRD